MTILNQSANIVEELFSGVAEDGLLADQKRRYEIQNNQSKL